jgi:hypothetical protein
MAVFRDYAKRCRQLQEELEQTLAYSVLTESEEEPDDLDMPELVEQKEETKTDELG